MYQTPVKQYYENNNSGTSKTIYRNSYFATTSNMTTVLTNEVSGINNMALSSGTKEVSGLSVENIATKGITVEEAANKTENTSRRSDGTHIQCTVRLFHENAGGRRLQNSQKRIDFSAYYGIIY